MPTANRKNLVPLAIDYFLQQDYPNIELIIIDDGEESVASLIPSNSTIKYFYNEIRRSIGNKRNDACEKALGEIIVHWDDDDWYAADWVSQQVSSLIRSGADICGLGEITYLMPLENESWTYKAGEEDEPWVYGGTLAYWRSFWSDHRFEDMQAGEDNNFIWNSGAKIYAHHYTNGYIAIVHHTNIGINPYEDPKEKIQITKWWKEIEYPERKVEIFNPTINSDLPLVSCIMPTANRANFIPSAINNFLKQNYPYKELIIIDDGTIPIKDIVPNLYNIRYFYTNPFESIGFKRNYACQKAAGIIIMHWDDDDWYSEDWITYQVDELRNSKADICGLDQVQFYSPIEDKYWMSKNLNSKRPWLSGATLAYWKSFWEKHPFKDMKIKEDDDFVRSSEANVYAHNYYQGFIATLHAHNTSVKQFEDPATKQTDSKK
ncbi:glycosyltransferase family 2 protein [Pedobacter hartonius]|nr:glycosyltransferase family A protein [Pedobacter hartonius]